MSTPLDDILRITNKNENSFYLFSSALLWAVNSIPSPN
nr:MAG TPA: hypothetical protein [Bacteriophage sp.]